MCDNVSPLRGFTFYTQPLSQPLRAGLTATAPPALERMPDNEKNRIASDVGVALLAAIAAFFVSFFVFYVAYITWAVHTYPRYESMMAFAAFFYGIPVGGAFALVTFVCVFIWRRRRNRPT